MGVPYLTFDKSLDEELYRKRKEIAIRKILEGEYSDRDLAKVYGHPVIQQNNIPKPVAILPDIPGSVLATGIGAALGPLLISVFDKGKISTALKLLSMPITALGGVTLYSLLAHNNNNNKSKFTNAYPIGPNKNILR